MSILQLSLLQWIAICILAVIPVLAWSYIFFNRTDESKKLLMRTFLFGGLATIPFLVYRLIFSYFPSLNFISFISERSQNVLLVLGPSITIPVSVIIIFFVLGIFEEIFKALIVIKLVPKTAFDSVSDVVEFSIAAGLGFAFIENISYIGEVYYLYGAYSLIPLFISRSLFATFAHALFSGIFGYYYGMGILQKDLRDRDVVPVIPGLSLYQKLAGKVKIMTTKRIFTFEETLVGLLLAGALHAVYNIFLESNFTLFLIPFLVFGFTFLDELIAPIRKAESR